MEVLEVVRRRDIVVGATAPGSTTSSTFWTGCTVKVVPQRVAF
jgi:hypothetical protein